MLNTSQMTIYDYLEQPLRKSMKGRAAGKQRDAKIVAEVEKCKILTREQVQELLFEGKAAGKKCRERLRHLVKQGQLNRGRCEVSDSYCYYQGKKPGKANHQILANWIYVAAKKQGYEVKTYIPEYFTEYVIPDGLLLLGDTGQYIPLFVELQREINNSPFDKVEKYTDYFLSREWEQKEWPEKTEQGKKRFNRILVVTDGEEKDAQKMRDYIEEKNEKGLRFRVATLRQVITDLRKVIE